jgi:hypothetical protein
MDVDHEASEMDVDLPLANIPRARCICGSNTHSRRTHRNCPLNNNPGNGQRNNQYLIIARQIEQLPERHFLGEMIQRCTHCSALLWLQERSEGGLSNPKFQLCCGLSRYTLAPLFDTPPFIKQLLQTNTEESKEFMKNIRAYNNALSFVSLGVKF